jgi:Flp pilus assembly protein TadD
MLATKNRTVKLLRGLVALMAMATLLTACTPTGPGALVTGRKLLEAGRTDEAIAKLQLATQLMATNAAAWNYLGVAFHRAGQWTNAADAYSRAVRFNRDLLETRFNLGCLWLDQDQPELAKTELLAYTLRQGDDAEGWTKLGTAQLGVRELTAAEKSFRAALRLDARHVEALNGLGMVFGQRNRGRDAADSFAAALQVQPQHRAALLNLATVQLQQLHNSTEALKRYREYLALQPRSADWEAVNAIVRSLEQPTITATAARPASNPSVTSLPLSLTNPVARPPVVSNPAPRPSVPAATKTEAPVAVNRTSPPTATPTVATTASRPPAPTSEIVKPSVEPAVKIITDDAPVVRRTENPPQPTPESKGLLSKLNPFKRESNASGAETKPTNGVASTSTNKTAATEAETYVAITAAKPKPGDRRAAEAALVQGQQAQRARRLAEALQFYRRAVHLDESYFEAHYCLGLVAFETRSFKLATTAWGNALLLRPDSADARYNYALTLKADGRYQAAADELEKLLALHPDEARGHLTLGILYAEHVRDIPRARLHYSRVLQLDPRNPQAAAIRYWLVANPR